MLALFILVGCGSSERRDATSGSRVVEDALGRIIDIPSDLPRIVSLAPGITETIVAAGGITHLVGVTTADDYPTQIQNLPRFSALPLNYEAVLSLKPDLVFATSQINNLRDAEFLEQTGIPTFFLSSGKIESIPGNIRTIGELLGTEEAAESAAAEMEQRLQRLRVLANQVESRPDVLVLVTLEPLYSFGRDSYIQDLVELAGGHSITGSLENQAPRLSSEFVLTREPEVIVGAFPEETDVDAVLAVHPAWQNIPAVRTGRILAINPDHLLRDGPRVVDAAEALFGYLHPTLVSRLR